MKYNIGDKIICIDAHIIDSSEVYKCVGIIRDINYSMDQSYYCDWDRDQDGIFDFDWWVHEDAIRLAKPPSKILAKLLEVLNE